MGDKAQPPCINTVIEWECSSCNGSYKSYSREHHKMDLCECKKSGVDLESYYCRMMGDVKVLRQYKESDKPSTHSR
jgi:hypothetical protein